MNTHNSSTAKPKYKKLYKWLTDRILDGTYQYQQKLPSESALCTQFGYSRQTVRNALGQLEADGYIVRSKGSGSFVKKQTRSKDKIIGVLFTTLGNYVTSNILTGLETVFTQKGYSLLLELSHNNVENETLFLRKMITSNVAGLIIEGARSTFPSPNAKLYERLSELRIPYVFVNNYYSNVSCPSIIWDDEQVSYRATKQLIDSGHKKIAGLFRFDEIQGPNRYLGYVRALIDNQIPVDDNLISWCSFSNHPKELHRQNLLIDTFIDDILDSCTALICYNDFIACHVVPYLSQKGISIPNDLTVVSFDNSDITKLYNSQSVPSIEHPKEKLGELAANILLKYIEDPSADATVCSRVKFPVSHEQELTFERIKRYHTNGI